MQEAKSFRFRIGKQPTAYVSAFPSSPLGRAICVQHLVIKSSVPPSGEIHKSIEVLPLSKEADGSYLVSAFRRNSTVPVSI